MKSKKIISILIAAVFLFNQTAFSLGSSDLLSALRPEKTKGPVADEIGRVLDKSSHRASSKSRIMLLFDIDHTLLDRDEKSWPEFPTYKPFIELLKKAKEQNTKIGLLTNLDYDGVDKAILQFIPSELRKNLILYTAGPLQKYSFEPKGRPVETRVKPGSYITPQEKIVILTAIAKTKRQYLRRLSSDRETYERLYPGFHFEEMGIDIRGKRKNGCVAFITFKRVPSARWPFSRLKKDEMDERAVFINELKKNLPPELREKLWVREGGYRAIDISKKDTTKAIAISDIISAEKIERANIVYIADEFAPNASDAKVFGTGVRCLSVSNKPGDDIPGTLWAGGGPQAAARWMDRILTYMETERLVEALGRVEDELIERQVDRLSLREFIGRLRNKGLVPDGIEERSLLQYAAILLKALERFSGIITATTKPNDEIQPIYWLLDYVESSNLFDEYRIKKNLPVVVVFKGSVYREDDTKTPWRVVYTLCSDFDSYTTIYGDEDNSDFILGLGGVKYYADIFNLKQRLPVLFIHNVRGANVIDARNSLWGIPFNGASTSIAHNPDSTATRKEVIKKWSSALFSAGVLGKKYFAKPDRGTAEEEMGWIQDAADITRRELERMGARTESYQPVATSISIPHNKWMATGHSIMATLSAVSAVFNICKEKASVIIYGFGNIGESTIRLLKSEGVKIVGVADSEGAVYDSKGLNVDKLLRLKRKGRQVTDYDKDKIISHDELLSKRATALLTLAVPNVITTFNYKSLKVKLIVDSVYSSLQQGADMERVLQDEKSILYLPSSLSSGGGAWASSEEIFHKNADIDIRNIKGHVLDEIRKISFTTTILLLKMWLASDKRVIPARILRDIAESIRIRRNDLLRNPTSNIDERAEYEVLVGVPERMAYLYASVEAARDEILYKDEDIHRLCDIVSDVRTLAWEKAYAAYVLGRKRDLGARDALVAALHKKSLDKQGLYIRENVAEALGQIWAGSAIEDLLAVYRDSGERASLKNWVGWTLERMGVAPHFTKKPQKSVTFKEAIQEIPQKVVRRYIYRKGRHIKRPVVIGISGFSASGKTYFVNELLENIRDELKKKVPGQDVKIVHLEIDDYLLAKEERVTRTERLGIPLSIFIKFEFQRFVSDMKRLAARKPIYIPHFDQVTRKRERADEGLMQEVRVLAEQGARKVRLEFEGQSHTLIRHEGLSNKENRGVYIDLQTADILRELKPGVDIVVVAEGILALADKEAVNVYDEAVFMTALWELRLRRDIHRYIESGKYASMTTEEVNAKFERKRIQEETKYISDQQELATYIIDTSDAKVPAYINAYIKVLADFQAWMGSLAEHPERPITLEQKEKKLNEFFILHRLDRIKKTPLLHKVWTRLYQNLIVPKRSSAFKAVSDFISEQNKEGYFTMNAAKRDKVAQDIIDEYKLYEDESIKLMFLHAVRPPDAVVKAAKKVVKRKRVKPKRRKRPAALKGLSATAEKSIAVKLLNIFAPHRMDLLDEMLDSVRYDMRAPLFTDAIVREIDMLITICMDLDIYKDSKIKYRLIFMHEAVHFLQKKGVIPLVKYETEKAMELLPVLIEEALLFSEISGEDEISQLLREIYGVISDIRYGMEAYHSSITEEQIMKELDNKFEHYMEETQTIYRDEDVWDNAETWRGIQPKEWQRFVARVVVGMAYAYALDKKDPEKIWDYVLAFIKYGGERLKLNEDEIHYALDDFEASGLSKIPFKSRPDFGIKSSSAGRQGEQADPLVPAFPMSIKGLMADAGYDYYYKVNVKIQEDGRIDLIVYGDLELEASCFDRYKAIKADVAKQLRRKGYLIEERRIPDKDRVDYYVLFVPHGEDFSIPKSARADPDIFTRDIRAEIEKLPDDVCYNLGRSFATLLRESTGKEKLWLSVGGDVRKSTSRVYYYFIRGLMDSGINIYKLGTVPTPVTYFSASLYETDGFASITGSHNPPGYNGIKPGIGGINLDIEQMARLKEIFFAGQYYQAAQRGKIVDKSDILDTYVEYLQAYLLATEEEWQEHIINGKNLKAGIKAILNKHKGEQPLEDRRIAFDSGNGACGYLPQRVWVPLGTDLRLLYPEFDGTYPHHIPNPQELENLKDLIELVGAESYELGFAVDGDMDRVGAVDPEQITGEDIFCIIAEEVLKNNPGAKVVVEAKASYSLMEHIRRHGGEVVISRVGFSNVQNAISNEGAILGGETSGHIYMRDNGYRDDGLFVATALLKIIGKTGKSLRELLSDVHYCYISPEIRIFLKKNTANEIISDLKRMYKGKEGYEINEIDGIRIQLNDKQGRWLGWFIVRASATEPKITVRFEGRNEHYYNRMAKELFGFLNRYDGVEFGEYSDIVSAILSGTPAVKVIPTPGSDVDGIKSSSTGDTGYIEEIYTSPIELARHIIGLSSGEMDVTSAKKDLAAIRSEFEKMEVDFKTKPQIMEGIDFETLLPSCLLNFSLDPEDKESILTTPAYWKLQEYIESKRTEPVEGRYDIDPILSDPQYIEDLLSKEDIADIERLCYCPSFLIRRKAIRCLGVIHNLKKELVSKKRLLAVTIDVLIQDILDDISYIEKAFKDARFLKETGINIFGKPIKKEQVKQVGAQLLDTGTEKLIYKITLQLEDKPKPLIFVVATIRPNDAAYRGWETDKLQGADRKTITMSHQNWRGLIKLKNPAMPALGGIVDFKIANPVSTVETYMDHGDGGMGGKLFARREKEVIICSAEFVEGKTLAQKLENSGISHAEKENLAVEAMYSILKIWLDTVNIDGLGVALLDPHPSNFIYRKGELRSIDNERLVYGYTLEESTGEVLRWMKRQELDPLILSKALLRLGEEALRKRIKLAPSERILRARDEARFTAIGFGGEVDKQFMPGARAFDVDEVVEHYRMIESIQAERAAYESIGQAA